MTVHSDWGDWLPRAIDEADPDGLALWYLGCNGLAMKASDGTTIFVDPYLGLGDPPRTLRMIPIPFAPEDVRTADAVFGTHEHTDHVHGPSQAPILAGTGADYYTTDAGLEVVAEESWTGEWAVEESQLHEITEGDELTVGGVTVAVEPANDPDADHPVALLFQYEGLTVLHGGDARPGAFEPIAENYDVDLGQLAFGSVGMIDDKATGEPQRTRWYSDENDVVEAANEAEVDTLVPSHWDMWKGMTADPTALHEHARSFPFPKRLEVTEIGDRIDLPLA